ncbi:prepilin peptidase CpaA [Roseicitreum antarcticum]|uniref:Prepilin peptidase CpaA n=2 Tax=Roseicitreum antarcticum TaxID=564137 RepID=A0A1H2XKV5_9RHOB|nr:prepilin peptidase CpaA [Roseicitreum antarcticum]
MYFPAAAAAWMLPGVVLIGLWVAWSDMKFMRIPNKAVMALLLLYVAIGPFVLPLSLWAWGGVHLAVVLAIGFLMTLTGLVGAGDAKFAAAMAPFIMIGDLSLFLPMLAAVIIASLVAHRVVRRIPAVRAAAPTWASWERREFPMGLALGPALAFYMALAAVYGV